MRSQQLPASPPATAADSTRRQFLNQTKYGLAASAAALWLSASAAGGAAADANRDETQARDPQKKLGIALVGLGSLSEGQLAPALEKTQNCRLAGLVSGHPDKAARWAQKHNVPAKNIYDYETFDRIADNPDIDIVYVVLPNAMHAEYAIRAAKAGKHVLCEKPMAVSVAECERMIAACADAKRLLAIGYRLRFEPHHQAAMRLGQERILGPVKLIDAAFGFHIGDPNQWRLKRDLAGGGALMDVGIYALQAARYVTGEEPIEVAASEVKTDPIKFREVDETLAWQFKFPSGALAYCATSYMAGPNHLRVYTDHSSFEIEPAYGYGGIQGRAQGGSPIEGPAIDQFAAEMDDFAACARANKPSRVPGEEGLRDVRIMRAIYEAVASGRTVKLT